MTQQTWDFDLDPKLKAIGRLKVPGAVRKLLTALAVFGCSHPEAVVLGSGGEDGEWLVDVSREQLAAVIGKSVPSLKRWLRAIDSFGSDLVALSRSEGKRHGYWVSWAAVFAAAGEASAENEPGSFSKMNPVQGGQNDPGEPGSVCKMNRVQGGHFEPGSFPSSLLIQRSKIQDNQFKTSTTKDPTNQADNPLPSAQRGWGRVVTEEELGRTVGIAGLFRTAVEAGWMLDCEADRQTFFALAAYVRRVRAGRPHDQPGLLLTIVRDEGRDDWERRISAADDEKARQKIAWLDELSRGAGRAST